VTRIGLPRRDAYTLAALACVIAIAPFALSGYYLGILITTGLYGITTVGLCLLVGYAKQISLGHAAFYGLGAYASGLLATRLGLSPWIALVAAAAIAVAAAALVGYPVLRLHGNYLAMATLGLGIVFTVVLREWTDVTAGPSGFSGIPELPFPALFAKGDANTLWLVWIVVLALVALALVLVNSRFGRTLRAIGDSEVGAELLGIDVARWKLALFALSAGYAAVGGALYAHYVTFLSPEPFGFVFSLELLVMAVVGGIANVWGGLLGAFVIVALTETLRHALPSWLPGSSGELEPVLFGVILVAVLVLRPAGLAGMGASLLRVSARRRAPRSASTPEVSARAG
jgi:branched-chain amino acid transport system permease protein